MRILYVEDNPANLFLIKRVAKMGDHEVVNLIDGEEALRKIDLIKPDLILMDIQLAGQLTGLDVVRKLRQDGLTVPIVAVTAYAMVGDRERCLEAGCNEYLSKPLPIGRVVELIQLYQSGVPAATAQKESDEVYLPIDKSAAAPTPAAATPVESAPAASPATPADNVPAVAATPAATPDITAAPPAPNEAAAPVVPSTPAAPVLEEEPTLPAPPDAPPTQPSAPTTSEAAPKEEAASDAGALPTSSAADASAPLTSSPAVTGEPPIVLPGTDKLSDPAVESTSQDSSHPQDTTVQAQ